MNEYRPPVIRPEYQPLSIVKAVWKGKLYVAAIAGLTAVVTYVVVSRIPSIYRAEAVVLVDSQKIPQGFVSSTVSTKTEDRLAAINRQILSADRLRQLIDEMDLYPGTHSKNVPDGLVDLTRRNIQIRLDKGWAGGLTAFRVGYSGPKPKIVADVANRLASFFVEENLKEREGQAEGTAEFVEVQLRESKRRLDELETAVSHYKAQHRGELPEQQNALLGTLGRLQAELRTNSDAINRVQQNKVMLENNLDMAKVTLESALRSQAEPPPPGQVTPPTRATATPKGDPELDKLEAQLKTLRLRYSDDHPDVKRVTLAIQRLVELRKAAGAGETAKEKTEPKEQTAPVHANVPAAKRPKETAHEPQELVQLRGRIDTLKSQIALTEKEVETRSTEEERIRREMGQIQSRIDRLPYREQEMAEMTRDYQIAKTNYQTLLGKKLAADMAIDLERRQKAERFTIIDPARVPSLPIGPNRRRLYGLGAGFGLLLGLAVAFGNELRRNVLLGDWELPRGTVILGSLPRIQIDGSSSARQRSQRRRVVIWSAASAVIAIACYVIGRRL